MCIMIDSSDKSEYSTQLENDREAADYLLAHGCDERDKDQASLTSTICLSMTCGSFMIMCGMIGIFYTMYAMTEGDKVLPRQLHIEVGFFF